MFKDGYLSLHYINTYFAFIKFNINVQFGMHYHRNVSLESLGAMNSIMNKIFWKKWDIR